MKGKIIPALIFIVLIGTTKVFAHKTDTLKLGTWQTIHKGYTVKYPGNWTFDESGKSGTTFIIFSPKENDQDPFIENVNLLIQDLGETGYDLKKYMEITQDQLKSYVSNVKIFENKLMNGKDGDYQVLIWSGDVSGRNLKFEQLVYVHDKKAWLLTLSVDPINWDLYKAAGETILKSFAPNFK